MEIYKDKSREELLKICKDKFVNGSNYEELTHFLNLHEIDKDTQKYILDELQQYEQELKAIPQEKKMWAFTPINMMMGVGFILLGLIILFFINMQHGRLYPMALILVGGGAVLIVVEIIKIIITLFRKKTN